MGCVMEKDARGKQKRTTDQEEEEEEEEIDQEEEEMDEMVVKELKDMQQHIRDMLPTNPEIEEWMSQYRGFGRWIKEMKDLSEYIQELVDSGNAISKEDVAGIKQRFRLHNCSYEMNKLHIDDRFLLHNCSHEENKVYVDETMNELKAMQLHIQEKLADAEDYQIGRGETMQKWLDDIRNFSRKIEPMIEYLHHLEQKRVPYPLLILEDLVDKFQHDFRWNVIMQEAMSCCGVSTNYLGIINGEEKKELIEIMKDDIESMSMWIDFILTSTVSQGITQRVKILLEKLKQDLLEGKKYMHIIRYYINSWKNLRWQFYKIRQIQSLHSVTRHVNWNLFGFTKTQTVEMLEQVTAMGVHIKDRFEEAKKWNEERHGEGQQKDDTRMFFQQALDLLNHDEPRSTDILVISKLQVDLDKFQRHFFQTSIWVDACIQATGKAMLSSSRLSSRSKEAYYIIKEDTEIMLWHLHVIMLVVKQQGWETTAGWLYELRGDLDQLLKSSSHFGKFDPALLFCGIIGWGLLKGKLQMTDKHIQSLQLRLATNSSDCSRQEMDGIIKYLKNKHEWIKARLDDAEDEKIQGKTHQKWLSELRDLAYQAEDLIGLYEYQQVANKVNPTSSLEQLSIFCQQKTILCEITDGAKKFKEEFHEVAKNYKYIHVTIRLPSGDCDNHLYTHEPTGYLPLDRTKFVGREEKMKELKEALVSVHGGESTSTEVIAVVGMGGVGKTTLCQHIYGDHEIRLKFPISGWVHVGGKFDLIRVANDILISLSKENVSYCTQFAPLQEKINKYVDGKKLLLVLDDVWTGVITDWEKITTLFNDAGNGSKILISTRHEHVAKIAGAAKSIRLDKLSSTDGWSLFKIHAFREDPPPKDLVDVGEAILAKCCGLPLAIKVVGSLLRRKGDGVDNWSSLLNSNWWNFNMHEGDKENQDILGPLYLSYWHLPRHLKTCFRFVSLFEKGEEIQIERLSELWVANNLISDDNGSDSIREEGHKWIQDLASRSIVDIIRKTDKFEDTVRILIKVHDLIHDIVQSVSGNEFCVLGRLEKGSRISLDGVRHLHVPWDLNVDDNLFDTRRDLLRTIIVKHIHNCHQLIDHARNMRLLHWPPPLLPENLSFARNLRVLKFDRYIGNSHCVMLPTIYMLYNLRQVHINSSNIVNVSCRIGNLINLRHLDLSCNEFMLKIPESISRLTALQYLNLEGCESLQELPSGISNLKALRDLNLRGCKSLKELPSGISNLKALRDLNLGGCYAELPCGISDLTNLRALDVSSTAIKYMPCWLSRLTKLTRLPYFPLGLQEEHASLKSLKAFQQLEGKLRVRVNIVGCVKEEHAQEIEMSDSRQLSYLSIEFCNYMSDSGEQHEQILQKLKPNVKMTELNIHYYKGVKLPSWMGNRSYEKLVNIELCGLNRCTSLSPLHMLPSLEMLEVNTMESLRDLLEVVLEEENGGSSNTGSIEHPAKPEPKLYFPKLVCLQLSSCGIEYLRLYDCWFPALKSLSICECDFLKDIHFSDPTSALEQSQNEGTPSLTELTIRYCEKLCFGRDALLPLSLKKLTIWGNNEAKRWCESNRASRLSHVPDIDLR